MDAERILLAICAVWGFAGVAMLAGVAHGSYGEAMVSAGQLLLFHALAVMTLLGHAFLKGFRRALPMALMLTGSGLFATEVALHAGAGIAFLTFLAPVGGLLCLLAWAILAVSALIKPK